MPITSNTAQATARAEVLRSEVLDIACASGWSVTENSPAFAIKAFPCLSYEKEAYAQLYHSKSEPLQLSLSASYFSEGRDVLEHLTTLLPLENLDAARKEASHFFQAVEDVVKGTYGFRLADARQHREPLQIETPLSLDNLTKVFDAPTRLLSQPGQAVVECRLTYRELQEKMKSLNLRVAGEPSDLQYESEDGAIRVYAQGLGAQPSNSWRWYELEVHVK